MELEEDVPQGRDISPSLDFIYDRNRNDREGNIEDVGIAGILQGNRVYRDEASEEVYGKDENDEKVFIRALGGKVRHSGDRYFASGTLKPFYRQPFRYTDLRLQSINKNRYQGDRHGGGTYVGSEYMPFLLKTRKKHQPYLNVVEAGPEVPTPEQWQRMMELRYMQSPQGSRGPQAPPADRRYEDDRGNVIVVKGKGHSQLGNNVPLTGTGKVMIPLSQMSGTISSEALGGALETPAPQRQDVLINRNIEVPKRLQIASKLREERNVSPYVDAQNERRKQEQHARRIGITTAARKRVTENNVTQLITGSTIHQQQLPQLTVATEQLRAMPEPVVMQQQLQSTVEPMRALPAPVVLLPQPLALQTIPVVENRMDFVFTPTIVETATSVPQVTKMNISPPRSQPKTSQTVFTDSMQISSTPIVQNKKRLAHETHEEEMMMTPSRRRAGDRSSNAKAIEDVRRPPPIIEDITDMVDRVSVEPPKAMIEGSSVKYLMPAPSKDIIPIAPYVPPVDAIEMVKRLEQGERKGWWDKIIKLGYLKPLQTKPKAKPVLAILPKPVSPPVPLPAILPKPVSPQMVLPAILPKPASPPTPLPIQEKAKTPPVPFAKAPSPPTSIGPVEQIQNRQPPTPLEILPSTPSKTNLQIVPYKPFIPTSKKVINITPISPNKKRAADVESPLKSIAKSLQKQKLVGSNEKYSYSKTADVKRRKVPFTYKRRGPEVFGARRMKKSRAVPLPKPNTPAFKFEPPPVYTPSQIKKFKEDLSISSIKNTPFKFSSHNNMIITSYRPKSQLETLSEALGDIRKEKLLSRPTTKKRNYKLAELLEFNVLNDYNRNKKIKSAT